MPDLRGAVLLLEDVDEPPYKVDRMLLHLRRPARWAASRAWPWASSPTAPTTGRPPSGMCSASIWATSGVPVLGGLPVGHGRDQLTVPVGVPAVLDATAGTLTVEPAVQ